MRGAIERRSSGLPGEHGHAARVELGSVGFVLAPGKDIHFVRHDHVDEAGEREYLPPLCFQQSTGNSATPEFDVVLRLLRHFFVDEDVTDLDPASWLEDAEHLPEYGGLVGAEVDDAVTDDDIRETVRHGQ